MLAHGKYIVEPLYIITRVVCIICRLSSKYPDRLPAMLMQHAAQGFLVMKLWTSPIVLIPNFQWTIQLYRIVGCERVSIGYCVLALCISASAMTDQCRDDRLTDIEGTELRRTLDWYLEYERLLITNYLFPIPTCEYWQANSHISWANPWVSNAHASGRSPTYLGDTYRFRSLCLVQLRTCTSLSWD